MPFGAGDFRQAALGRPGKVLRLAGTSVSVLGAVLTPERCEVVSSGLSVSTSTRSNGWSTPPVPAICLPPVSCPA